MSPEIPSFVFSPVTLNKSNKILYNAIRLNIWKSFLGSYDSLFLSHTLILRAYMWTLLMLNSFIHARLILCSRFIGSMVAMAFPDYRAVKLATDKQMGPFN